MYWHIFIRSVKEVEKGFCFSKNHHLYGDYILVSGLSNFNSGGENIYTAESYFFVTTNNSSVTQFL